jgi:hypothetical protein
VDSHHILIKTSQNPHKKKGIRSLRSLSKLRELTLSALLGSSLALGGLVTAIPMAHAQSVDPNSLVTYTGTGWDMDILPGWAPLSTLGAGWIGGNLPDGKTQAALYVKSTDAKGQGLDVLAPVVVKALTDGLGTGAKMGASAAASVDGQSGVSQDFSLGSGSDATTGRAIVFIEDGDLWIIAFIANTEDASKAGLDMFKNQLLTSFETD